MGKSAGPKFAHTGAVVATWSSSFFRMCGSVSLQHIRLSGSNGVQVNVA